MARVLLVQADKEFRVSIPDDARVTFAPFSPPSGRERGYGDSNRAVGTLRIYDGKSKAKESILGMWTGVKSFRTVDIDYSEKVAVEEGATMWKSDQNGYEREEKVSRKEEWTDPDQLLLEDKEKEIDF